MAEFSPKSRQRIEAMAAAEIREIRALRAIHRAAGAAQVELARRLGEDAGAIAAMGRPRGLDRLERFVDARGGRVELVVRLEGREPLRIALAGDGFEFGGGGSG